MSIGSRFGLEKQQTRPAATPPQAGREPLQFGFWILDFGLGEEKNPIATGSDLRPP
jgi:hypothetical protein